MRSGAGAVGVRGAPGIDDGDIREKLTVGKLEVADCNLKM
jgi:hypothetical protein